MLADQPRPSRRQLMREVGFAAIGLFLLISGIVVTDWVRIIAGAMLVLGAALALVVARLEARPSPTLSPDEARAEVMAVAVAGDRVGAVRVLRERTGLGLADATRTVQRWLAEDGIPWR